MTRLRRLPPTICAFHLGFSLVDGQHRLQAAVNADWTGPWVITCLWGEERRAEDIYIQLDTSQKVRKPRS